jgi:hypothetical protein
MKNKKRGGTHRSQPLVNYRRRAAGDEQRRRCGACPGARDSAFDARGCEEEFGGGAASGRSPEIGRRRGRAAAGTGARGGDEPEGERECRGRQEEEQLTRKLMELTARAEELRNAGELRRRMRR